MMNAANRQLTNHPRKLGRQLMVPVICLGLIGIFYAEENWRGKRAWEQCKQALASGNIPLNWTNYMPAAIPEDQNVFGVPEMVTWFSYEHGAGWPDFARVLPSPAFPGFDISSNTPALTVAEIMIGQPDTPTPTNFTELRWDDPGSRIQAANLINRGLGPIAKASQSPIGVGLMLREPYEVQPARILLRCQTPPTAKDLETFLPGSIIQANTGTAEKVLKFEPQGDGSYRVTIPRLGRAADYLAWSEILEPQFALIRGALRRPYAQLPGLYTNPHRVPIVNFVAVRNCAANPGSPGAMSPLAGYSREKHWRN